MQILNKHSELQIKPRTGLLIQAPFSTFNSLYISTIGNAQQLQIRAADIEL